MSRMTTLVLLATLTLCAAEAAFSSSPVGVGPRLSIVLDGGSPFSLSKPVRNFVLAEEGSDLGLTCRVTGVAAAARYQAYRLNWYVTEGLRGGGGGDRVAQKRGRNSFGLVLGGLRPEDSGTLKCTAEPERPYHSERDEDNAPEPPLEQTITLKVKSSSGFCGPSFFQCPSAARHCIGLRFLCDGVPDCPDGADESEARCGRGDPCAAKLRCADGRCMDPALCCAPQVGAGDGGTSAGVFFTNCTYVPSCCLALLEANRHFYQLGRDSRNKEDLKFLHSTIFTVIGCIVGLICLIVIVTTIICRLHMRRQMLGLPPGAAAVAGGGGAGARTRAILSLHDLDLYFASLQGRGGSVGGSRRGARGGGRGQQQQQQQQPQQQQHSIGITYNINNGVQFVAAPAPPPPYDLDPPPPYEAEGGGAGASGGNSGGGAAQVAAAPAGGGGGAAGNVPAAQGADGGGGGGARDSDDENDALLNNNEDNNNGDINGNSELVNQNIVVAEEEARQLLFNNQGPAAAARGAAAAAVTEQEEEAEAEAEAVVAVVHASPADAEGGQGRRPEGEPDSRPPRV